MPRTARRRWTRDFDTEVDGIALGAEGPLLVHGYDPPAGGKWMDDAIPGKLAALDRTTGQVLWNSPCEVGYGRGFGAGFGGADDAIVLGPGTQGHRIVRMSLKTGELLAAREILAFDDALVYDDLCFMVSATRVSAVTTSTLAPRWSHAKEGERYHWIAREGDHLFVVYTSKNEGKQGCFTLNAKTGKSQRIFLKPVQNVIHAVHAGSGSVTFLLSDLYSALSENALRNYLIQNDDADLSSGGVSAISFASDASPGDDPRWYEKLDVADEEFPDVSITHDSGKLYLVSGASIEVRDLLSGKPLGDMTVPGLDERVSWMVGQGAGALAEETRLSIFEIPD
ncbi:MAG: hypothetical protein ACI8TQ_001572 [Planctomycetota bacterium]|jgi:hypothetical protein